MKEFDNVNLKEVWTIFSLSSKKWQFLIPLLMVIIIVLAVLIFGVYFPVVWIFMFILLVSYEDYLFQFIALDYKFLTPPLMTKPRKPSAVNELLNKSIITSMHLLYPKIVFKVNNESLATYMKTYARDGVSYIEIGELAMKVYSQKEFQAIIYHELGHIKFQHNNEFRLLFFLGYVVFIFLPILLPLFWLMGSYLSRYHELAADRFSLENDPNHFMLQAVQEVEVDKSKISFWKNCWYDLLFVTVAPNPSLESKIKYLKKTIES